MLNISNNRINKDFPRRKYSSLVELEDRKSGRVLIKILLVLAAMAVITLFLPWTQNIRTIGYVTTLRPEQKPQTLHSVIDGRIERWFVQEGDFVHKGDTILFISEIKDEYFDPNLLSRVEEQLQSKESSVQSYAEKVKALDSQIDALITTGKLKLRQIENKQRQAKLKVTSDSINYQASIIDFEVAKEQYARMEQLYKEGLKSLTDLEARKLKLQKAQADMVSYENKLLTSQNELINTEIEYASIEAQYKDDVAKAESDKYTALSSMYDAEATVTKLQNQYMNYSVRTGLYYIKSPTDGYITKAIQSGIGETIKAGGDIVSIMPANYDLAVEMYIKPIDLPLIERTQKVRIQFDGWPAIVFSGWPNTSYGTYGGVIYAMDNFISENGKFRVLVAPDKDDHPWPDALRIGGGTNNMVLLKEVPIWYELWRKVNGFPADYYKQSTAVTDTKKKSK